jgi:hypothetical protein
MIDTDGLRPDHVEIVKSDGSAVAPTGVDYPAFKPELMRGVQEEIYGPELAQGPTVAHFDKSAVGAGPWTVRVDIEAVPEENIRVGRRTDGAVRP